MRCTHFVCASGTLSNPIIILFRVYCPLFVPTILLLVFFYSWTMKSLCEYSTRHCFLSLMHPLYNAQGKKRNKGMGDEKERERILFSRIKQRNNKITVSSFFSSYKTTLSAPVAHLSISFPLWTMIWHNFILSIDWQ